MRPLREDVSTCFRTSHALSSLLHPRVGEEEGQGKVRAPGVLRSTGTETGAARCHHGKETPTALEPF